MFFLMNSSRLYHRFLNSNIDKIWKSNGAFRVFDESRFRPNEQNGRLITLKGIWKYKTVNSAMKESEFEHPEKSERKTLFAFSIDSHYTD